MSYYKGNKSSKIITEQYVRRLSYKSEDIRDMSPARGNAAILRHTPTEVTVECKEHAGFQANLYAAVEKLRSELFGLIEEYGVTGDLEPTPFEEIDK